MLLDGITAEIYFLGREITFQVISLCIRFSLTEMSKIILTQQYYLFHQID